MRKSILLGFRAVILVKTFQLMCQLYTTLGLMNTKLQCSKQGFGVGVARSRRFWLESEFKTVVESELESEKNARLRKNIKI